MEIVNGKKRNSFSCFLSAHGISLQVYLNITDIAKINIGKQWKEQGKQIYILFQVENEKTRGLLFTF